MKEFHGDVKIIVGANWGDEGKGQATQFYSRLALLDKKKCLNVLYNGGPQRGHTVEYQNGFRHVFHHFGSGTYEHADTYFHENFMVNPMMFQEEVDSIWYKTKIFINPSCRVITPYDMLINQIVEDARGENKHGSCGHGIWETQQRYHQFLSTGVFKPTFRWGQLSAMSEFEFLSYLDWIRFVYMPKRLREYDIDIKYIPQKYKDILASKKLDLNYMMDFYNMAKRTIVFDDEIFNQYDTVIFEGGQGLALDEDNTEEGDHVTASKTGSYVPMRSVKDFDCNVEICYVTRTYFTRHGNGKLLRECNPEQLGIKEADQTNIPNEFQGALRYAPFKDEDVASRIVNDFSQWDDMPRRTVLFTHANEISVNAPLTIGCVDDWFTSDRRTL